MSLFQSIVAFIVLIIIFLVILHEIYKILWKKELVIDARRIKYKKNKLYYGVWLTIYFSALSLISYVLFQLCKEIF